MRIGLVGARGYVGAELIALLARHPGFELAMVASRELAGSRVAEHVVAYEGALLYSNPAPDALTSLSLDALVLALPNGMSHPWVAAADALAENPVVVDLSADYRFDPQWYYGLPELTRARYAGQRRISNPGCYATAMQLAIAPLQGVLEGAVQCFGVSGYSGAGTTPSDKNDPAALRDNLIPYALTGHVHEREVSRHLSWPVEFMPHVAPHFRGLVVTTNIHLQQAWTVDELIAHYRAFYAGEALVDVDASAPWVSAVAGTHVVQLGGFAVAAGGRRAVIVSALDNLLKGAATQALQNLNLAFGFREFDGLALRSTHP